MPLPSEQLLLHFLSSQLWSALQFCESCWHSAKGSVLPVGSLLLGLPAPACTGPFQHLGSPSKCCHQTDIPEGHQPSASFSWCSRFSSLQFSHHCAEKRQAAPEVQAWEEKEPVPGCWLPNWLCCSLLPLLQHQTQPLWTEHGKSRKHRSASACKTD